MIGRHADEATVASHRRRIRAIAITDGVLLFAGVVALTVTLAVDNAPSVQADELPGFGAPLGEPKDGADSQTAGPVQPIFDFADVTPWDPGKNGEGAAVEVSRIATSSRVPTRTAVARVPAGAERAPVTSQPNPAPADPLHDDGTFGDGCEQPGTPERCDPKPPKDDPRTDDGEFGDGCETPGTPERCDPVVGLPPVIVEEPAEEETPVDEVEVVEPVTEVAG